MGSKRVVGSLLAFLAWAAGSVSPVRAQPAKAESSAGRPGPTWTEFRQLEAEVREQRQMLIQLMQTEQQRYDMLLRLLQAGANGATANPGAAPAAPATSEGERSRGGTTLAATRPPEREREREPRFGIIEGRVKVPGGDTSDLYVYIENYRGPMVRGRAVEIKQENKQFIPRVQVVPVGTSVTFPNLDPIFHNVFSNSPRNSFDLGSYRAGDQTRSAVFNSPGVVDIYCNIHQRMSAHVLVVPSKLYVRVRPDGGFRIEGVPTGLRTVVAWSPSLKPAQQKVEVGAGIASRVAFDLEYTDQKSHQNKLGQPYGSYKE
jgi:plastocyanin